MMTHAKITLPSDQPLRTRLLQAKRAYTTRRVPLSTLYGQPVDTDRGVHVQPRLLAPQAATQPGDLLLARVERLGQHDGLQLHTGRRAELYLGDHVLVCLGERYAPDQFEGVAQIDDDGGCDLLAAGGVAGTMRHKHARMKPATRLKVLGCLADAEGRPINVAQFAMPAPRAVPLQIPVVVVVGSSMNAGKTTACASLIHGLQQAGWRVGAAKITGTGSFGDAQSYADAGAAEVLDFTDAGLASTYRVALPALERVARTLVGTLQARGCNVAVVEIADGLFQRETAALLASRALQAMAGGALFAAGDAMGAVAGVQHLRSLGWRVLGFTGMVTCSPLASTEAEQALAAAANSAPVYTRDQLRHPERARLLVEGLQYASLPLAA
jgi:methylmalonyl-CoA mutase cobalamin-binding subunit